MPFNLHTQDSAVSSPQFAGGTCRLRFYGPIANSSPSTIPVIVEAMYPSGFGWSDVSSYFSHGISGRDLTLTAIGNLVEPESDTIITLRIRPRSQLTCSPSVMTGGAAAPTVYSFDWQFVP